MLAITDENNFSTSDNVPVVIPPEYIPAAKHERIKEKSFDEQYIQEYLRYPEKGKLDALRRAGHPNATRSKAWDLHNRLESQIDKALDKLIKQDAALGRSTLVHLTKNAQSESVRAACASKLMEYGDKAKPQRIVYEVDKVEDIDKEIEQIQKRIKAGMNTP